MPTWTKYGSHLERIRKISDYDSQKVVYVTILMPSNCRIFLALKPTNNLRTKHLQCMYRLKCHNVRIHGTERPVVGSKRKRDSSRSTWVEGNTQMYHRSILFQRVNIKRYVYRQVLQNNSQPPLEHLQLMPYSSIMIHHLT